MPTSICEYMPKVVLMYILILPFVIITFPYQLASGFEGDKFFDSIFAGAVGWLLIWGVYIASVLPISLFIDLDPKVGLGIHLTISKVVWFLGLVLGFIALIKNISFKIKRGMRIARMNKDYNFDVKVPTKLSLIKEFIKAKRNKYCIKLNWED